MMVMMKEEEEEDEQVLDTQEGKISGLNVHFILINYSQDEEKKPHHWMSPQNESDLALF